jgi:RNA polymerase sigma-70 factor (ECF subfamily)
MDPADEELVLRARRGDSSAFETVVARWNEPILALASRLTGDLEEAQDLRQMALLKLYQGMQDFEGRSRFSTWIYRMVLNLCRDRARARASRLRAFAGLVNERLGRTSAVGGSPGGNGSAVEPALEETGFHAADGREVAQLVAHAVLSLPAVEREVVVLRHYHDLSFPAIAEILGDPVTTVKSRMSRGLSMLRTRLAHLEA